MATVEEKRPAQQADDRGAKADSRREGSARKPLVVGLLTASGLAHTVAARGPAPEAAGRRAGDRLRARAYGRGSGGPPPALGARRAFRRVRVEDGRQGG